MLFYLLFLPFTLLFLLNYGQDTLADLPCKCKLGGNLDGTKIINGTEVTPGEFPWLVTLGVRLRNGRIFHYCGGTLINSRWILTAAHCLGLNISQISVGVGSHKLSEVTKRYGVVQEISHPAYLEFPLVYQDIGLIELNESVPFTDEVYPACLAEVDKFIYEDDLLVAGWGVIKEENRELTDVPMKAVLSQTQFLQCASQWFGLVSFLSHFCGFQKTQSPCFGDSGGALMSPIAGQGVEVVAIVSFGANCNSTKPTVFTKVSSFNNWIRRRAGDYCSSGGSGIGKRRDGVES